MCPSDWREDNIVESVDESFSKESKCTKDTREEEKEEEREDREESKDREVELEVKKKNWGKTLIDSEKTNIDKLFPHQSNKQVDDNVKESVLREIDTVMIEFDEDFVDSTMNTIVNNVHLNNWRILMLIDWNCTDIRLDIVDD